MVLGIRVGSDRSRHHSPSTGAAFLLRHLGETLFAELAPGVVLLGLRLRRRPCASFLLIGKIVVQKGLVLDVDPNREEPLHFALRFFGDQVVRQVDRVQAGVPGEPFAQVQGFVSQFHPLEVQVHDFVHVQQLEDALVKGRGGGRVDELAALARLLGLEVLDLRGGHLVVRQVQILKQAGERGLQNGSHESTDLRR